MKIILTVLVSLVAVPAFATESCRLPHGSGVIAHHNFGDTLVYIERSDRAELWDRTECEKMGDASLDDMRDALLARQAFISENDRVQKNLLQLKKQ